MTALIYIAMGKYIQSSDEPNISHSSDFKSIDIGEEILATKLPNSNSLESTVTKNINVNKPVNKSLNNRLNYRINRLKKYQEQTLKMTPSLTHFDFLSSTIDFGLLNELEAMNEVVANPDKFNKSLIIQLSI